MFRDELFCGANTAINWILTATQTDETLKTIQLILACITTAITIAYTIWKWYRKAKEDLKITEDEIDDLANQIHQIVHKDNIDEDKKDETSQDKCKKE